MADFALPDEFVVDIVSTETGKKSAEISMGELRRFKTEGSYQQFMKILERYNTKLFIPDQQRWK